MVGNGLRSSPGEAPQIRAYDIKLVSDSSPTHLTQNMSLEHGEGFWKGRWASKKEPLTTRLLKTSS